MRRTRPARQLLRSGTPLLVAIGVAIVVALGALVVNGATDALDRAVIAAVRQPALHDLLAPLRLLTEFGSTWMVTAIAVAVLLLLAARANPRWGLLSGATIAATSLVNVGVKRWVERARPDALDPLVAEHGFSFPSGHAMLGMTAWGIVAVVLARSDLPPGLRRALVAGCFVLVGLIGLSRVYLGVHFPSDVLAGWTAGAVIVLLYAAVTRRLARPQLAANGGVDGVDRVSRESTERGGAAAGADPAAPRSDPPGPR